MPINTAMTLGDIARSDSEAASVLDSYQLDYCCDGKQTLAQACRKANLDLGEVVTALARTQGKFQPDPGEKESTLTEQAGFILGRHHAFTHAKLPRIETLLARSIERHGAVRAELKAVGDHFAGLKALLDSHMLREEQSLLPRIEAVEKYRRAETPLPPECFGAIEELIRQSKEEHHAVADLLKQIRELTADFTPAADTSSTCGAAYQALEGLETNLMHHIHLENDVLFPRVQRLSGIT